MEQYTVDQVASLMDDSEIEAESEDESDSDIEEDPTFPLPTLHSDDEGDMGPLSRDTASYTMHTPPPHSPMLLPSLSLSLTPRPRGFRPMQ